MLVLILSAILMGTVIYDFVSHRIPNYYLLLGLVAGVTWQAWTAGLDGVVSAGAGMLTGLTLFVPIYALGGMAAGDVKLMGVVGCFLGAAGVLWAGAYSLMAGAVLGLFYLLCKGHLGRFLVRYWVMAVTLSRVDADEDDSARHRLPYAIAISIGTLLSLYWKPM